MSSEHYADPHPEYWEQYSNLQHVKHGLIREYLNGWFPKLGLGSWAGRILYIDTHAGRGRHATGDLGSPLVALRTFLDHRFRDRILQRSEVRFIFMERDAENMRALEADLKACPPLPSGVHVDRYAHDFQEVLQSSLDALAATGKSMAPSFMFVDPYGFKIPYPLLAEFMAFRGVELFVNVMWRYLDMAIAQAEAHEGMRSTLNLVFGSSRWEHQVSSLDSDTRCQQGLSLIRSLVGSKWATWVHMLGENNLTEYALLHLTNHDAGRDLMKTVMWKVCPMADGKFVARKADDPSQGILLVPEPDLTPLRQKVSAILRTKPTRWQALHGALRGDLWLDKHANQVVRELRREDLIEDEDYQGPFSARNNPLLRWKGKGTC
jgi:three-Cys-motif partner protein